MVRCPQILCNLPTDRPSTYVCSASLAGKGTGVIVGAPTARHATNRDARERAPLPSVSGVASGCGCAAVAATDATRTAAHGQSTTLGDDGDHDKYPMFFLIFIETLNP
eukprot:1651261-Pleurochrysis_carterae.AAC.1